MLQPSSLRISGRLPIIPSTPARAPLKFRTKVTNDEDGMPMRGARLHSYRRTGGAYDTNKVGRFIRLTNHQYIKCHHSYHPTHFAMSFDAHEVQTCWQRLVPKLNFFSVCLFFISFELKFRLLLKSGKHSDRIYIYLSLDTQILARSCRESCTVEQRSRVYIRV